MEDKVETNKVDRKDVQEEGKKDRRSKSAVCGVGYIGRGEIMLETTKTMVEGLPGVFKT